jgi:hypothetical protein
MGHLNWTRFGFLRSHSIGLVSYENKNCQYVCVVRAYYVFTHSQTLGPSLSSHNILLQ